MQSDLKVRAKPTLFKQTGSCFDTTNIQTIKVRDPPLAAAAPRAAIESVLGVPMASRGVEKGPRHGARDDDADAAAGDGGGGRRARAAGADATLGPTMNERET